MAGNATTTPNRGLYFIVGALVAVVVGFGALYFTGNLGGGDTKKLEISIGKDK